MQSNKCCVTKVELYDPREQPWYVAFEDALNPLEPEIHPLTSPIKSHHSDEALFDNLRPSTR